MKIVLTILSVLLIPLGYDICNYLFLDKIELFDINNPNLDKSLNPFHIQWWQFRIDLYCLIIFLVYFIYKLKTKYDKLFDFIIFIGIGFAEADCIDRWFFNTRTFTKTDIIMIIINIIIWYFTVYKNKKIKK